VVGSRSVEGIPTRAVIHRLTVRGTVLSSHLLGRTGWDYFGTAAVGTESGNLYIAGTRESRVSADVPVQAFLVKAGPLGNRDWERPLLIPPRADGRVTAATDLAMKPAGAVVAVGSAGGSPGGHDPGDDVDTVVVSFDPNGGRQWTRVTSTGRRNEGISVAVGSDGTSYVGGLTAGFHCSYSRFILRAFATTAPSATREASVRSVPALPPASMSFPMAASSWEASWRRTRVVRTPRTRCWPVSTRPCRVDRPGPAWSCARRRGEASGGGACRARFILPRRSRENRANAAKAPGPDDVPCRWELQHANGADRPAPVRLNRATVLCYNTGAHYVSARLKARSDR
jgi:hypothetical protein